LRDVGTSIQPGNDKRIIWDATASLREDASYVVKLVADDLFQINIQDLVDQVDSNRLISNLEFLEGVRHRNRKTGSALGLYETR